MVSTKPTFDDQLVFSHQISKFAPSTRNASSSHRIAAMSFATIYPRRREAGFLIYVCETRARIACVRHAHIPVLLLLPVFHAPQRTATPCISGAEAHECACASLQLP